MCLMDIKTSAFNGNRSLALMKHIIYGSKSSHKYLFISFSHYRVFSPFRPQIEPFTIVSVNQD